MRMSKGVEWAIHTLLNLGAVGDRRVSVTLLARAHDVSEPYLTKQLQQLVKHGLLTSTPGPRGGYSLGRSLDQITLLDVVEAIEGTTSTFHCAEIRCCGLIGELSPPPTGPCAVMVAMTRAEDAWREALRAETLGDIRSALEGKVHNAVRAALEQSR
ncbi:RrF2 family transcriptional regulator [Cryptosporangium sp. NPDC048952]|uniref:RrF2 family transcriptional regulator n=1 Tax=Cryptosporangium sp. NPDC048952 TaxID=3363961 RepID=UPI00372222FB